MRDSEWVRVEKIYIIHSDTQVYWGNYEPLSFNSTYFTGLLWEKMGHGVIIYATFPFWMKDGISKL